MQEWAFGDLLKALRRQKRLSQRALAEKLGVHRNTIWSWEQGVYLPDSRGMVVELAKQLSLNDQETRQLLEASLTAVSSYWQVPFGRNPFFTGREDILSRLHALLSQTTGGASLIRSCAIHGMGGIGKTQLAVEYAYRHRYDYEAVLWVQAETRDALVASFVALAHLLALPEQVVEDQGKLITMVLHWLNSHKGWLLIFDNVEDFHQLKPFLPASGQGAVLLTTRLHSVGSLAFMLELPPLSGQEGIQFLLYRARPASSSFWSNGNVSTDQMMAAQALVKMMDGLPLALDQAGAYVERTGCLLTDYLRMYESNQLRLLNDRRDNVDHPQSVVKTLLFSFRQLAQANEAAADLLRLCAFLAPDAIPEDLFLAGAAALGPLLGEVVSDAYQFNHVLGEAFYYSLLQRQPEHHTVSVHRLVQVVIKACMDEPTTHLWIKRAVAAVADCVALEGDKHAGERDCRYLLHARAVLQHIQDLGHWEEPAALTPIWYYIGLVAEQYGQTSEARDAYLQGLEIARRFSHPLEAALLVHGGYMVSDLGDDQMALSYLELGAQRARQINDKNTLGFALLNQGQIQDNLGHYQVAATMYREGLAVCRASGDWAMVSAFLQNLGVQAVRRGDYEQAEALYHEGLGYARQSQRLLPQSSLLMNLGMLAIQQQQYDQALTFTLESLELATQIRHRYMIASILQNLGIIYRHLGQLSQAQYYLDRSLSLAHELQNCWVVAETQGEYGWLLLEQEQPVRAGEMFTMMLDGARQIQASELIARALFGLAHVAARQHCWEQARSLALESLERFTLLEDAHCRGVSRWLATLPDMASVGEQGVPEKHNVADIARQAIGHLYVEEQP